jgi:hypothetical protein
MQGQASRIRHLPLHPGPVTEALHALLRAGAVPRQDLQGTRHVAVEVRIPEPGAGTVVELLRRHSVEVPDTTGSVIASLAGEALQRDLTAVVGPLPFDPAPLEPMLCPACYSRPCECR